MKTASETLTPVTLELGGKDAFIVCEDVNVTQVCHICADMKPYQIGILFLLHYFSKQVAQIAVRAALQSSGQNCAGAERFYVHSHIYPHFVNEIVKIVKSVRVVRGRSLLAFCFYHI